MAVEPQALAVAAAVTPAPIVQIEALRQSFAANEMRKGIDLDVQRGEVIANIGKSGSGKSTLLRCINGLEAFQHGSLPVDGLADEGMSSLRVTHEMNFACSACDRVVFMHAGRAVWQPAVGGVEAVFVGAGLSARPSRPRTPPRSVVEATSHTGHNQP